MITRFATLVPLSDRRVCCPRGHQFTPDLRLRVGRGDVTCHRCHDLLLVAVVREIRCRLVVQVTRDELAMLDAITARPGVDLLWLVMQPLGSAVALPPDVPLRSA